MSSVIPFRSHKKAGPAADGTAGGLLDLAIALRADSIEGIRDLIFKLDRINTHTRILVLLVEDQTVQQQLMANASDIEALIRVARARFENLLQTQGLQTPEPAS